MWVGERGEVGIGVGSYDSGDVVAAAAAIVVGEVDGLGCGEGEVVGVVGMVEVEGPMMFGLKVLRLGVRQLAVAVHVNRWDGSLLVRGKGRRGGEG